MKKFFCYILPFVLGITLMVVCVATGETSADQAFKVYESLSPEAMYKALKKAPEVRVEMISDEWIDGERIKTTQTLARDGDLLRNEWEQRNVNENKVVNDGREYLDIAEQTLYSKNSDGWVFQRDYQADWESLLEDLFPPTVGYQVFFEDDNYYDEEFSEDDTPYFLSDKAVEDYLETYSGDYTDENGDPYALEMRMYRYDTVYRYYLKATNSERKDVIDVEITVMFADQTVTLPNAEQEILHPSTPSAFYKALQKDDTLAMTIYEHNGTDAPSTVRVNYADDLLMVSVQQGSTQTTYYNLENQMRYADGNEEALEEVLDWDVFVERLNEFTGGLLELDDKQYQHEADKGRYVLNEAAAEAHGVRMATYTIVPSTDSFLYSVTYSDGTVITVDYYPNVTPTIELP